MKKCFVLLAALLCAGALATALAACASTGSAGGNSAYPPAPAASPGAARTLSLQEALEQAAAEIAGKLPSGASIAVVSFASESPNVSAYLMEELDFALLDRGLVVADRAALDSVRKELNFQASGEVSDETAQSIGHFLGVPYTATGQFQPAGDAYRFRVTVIQVERAVRAAAAVFNVRNDGALQKLVESLKKSALTTHQAGY
jgi:hypothetical protein